MRISFDELHARAKALADAIEGGDRDATVVAILKAFCALKREIEEQTIDAVEIKLLHQEHH